MGEKSKTLKKSATAKKPRSEMFTKDPPETTPSAKVYGLSWGVSRTENPAQDVGDPGGRVLPYLALFIGDKLEETGNGAFRDIVVQVRIDPRDEGYLVVLGDQGIP